MVVFLPFAIKRNPLRGKTNYAVWHLLLKEIPYGEIRWFISWAVLLKDIPYGETKLRRLAFAVEGNPLRGKPITLLGICY